MTDAAPARSLRGGRLLTRAGGRQIEGLRWSDPPALGASVNRQHRLMHKPLQLAFEPVLDLGPSNTIPCGAAFVMSVWTRITSTPSTNAGHCAAIPGWQWLRKWHLSSVAACNNHHLKGNFLTKVMVMLQRLNI